MLHGIAFTSVPGSRWILAIHYTAESEEAVKVLLGKAADMLGSGDMQAGLAEDDTTVLETGISDNGPFAIGLVEWVEDAGN